MIKTQGKLRRITSGHFKSQTIHGQPGIVQEDYDEGDGLGSEKSYEGNTAPNSDGAQGSIANYLPLHSVSFVPFTC